MVAATDKSHKGHQEDHRREFGAVRIAALPECDREDVVTAEARRQVAYEAAVRICELDHYFQTVKAGSERVQL